MFYVEQDLSAGMDVMLVKEDLTNVNEQLGVVQKKLEEHWLVKFNDGTSKLYPESRIFA